MSKPTIIYWDACVYLAWLKAEEEAHGKESIDALRETAQDNYEKKTVIVTSTITFIEVLSAKLDADQERRFRACFRSQDHISRDLDPPIAMRARDFRQRLLQEEAGKGLSTPDAIHLATASIYETSEFWTFDDGKKGRKNLGLLVLNGDERVGGLKICKPHHDRGPLLI
jgi:predicted nucleic acid-binding protein